MKQLQDSKLVLSEEELSRRMLCSMLRLPPVEDRMAAPSMDTLRWVLRERLSGAVPSASEMRTRFLFHWHKAWGDRPRAGDAYWSGPRASANLAADLRRFFLRYECLQPLEPYRLELQYGTITGHAAIVERIKVKDFPQPFVLDVRARQPKILHTPDYVGFARWLAVRQVFDRPNLGLVHLPLLFGYPWAETEVSEPLAKFWLESIMKQMAEVPDFPRAGTHCRECLAPCKEIFRGSDDRYRKGRRGLFSD